jgi:hypothetical protein
VKQVDFLSGVVGLTTKDLVRRAVELEVPGAGVLRVIHPIDVLDSRIQNLHALPEKRNRAGIAQATLAVDVARACIRHEVAAAGERAGLRLLERVADIAGDICRGAGIPALRGSIRWRQFRSRTFAPPLPCTRCAGRSSWQPSARSGRRCAASPRGAHKKRTEGGILRSRLAGEGNSATGAAGTASRPAARVV